MKRCSPEKMGVCEIDQTPPLPLKTAFKNPSLIRVKLTRKIKGTFDRL